MATQEGLTRGEDGLWRCAWHGGHADYRAYHDREWGRPVDDDHRLFEKLSLEGFQAGLSWLTILRKREAFRHAFAGFDYEKIARFDRRRLERLLADPGIVRHRGKIEATLHNARRTCELASEHGSLAAWVWRFEPEASERPRRLTLEALRAMSQTPASRVLAAELRRRGFRFVGPTTAYAFMQAMGLVNDHLAGCALRAQVEAERARFRRPR